MGVPVTVPVTVPVAVPPDVQEAAVTCPIAGARDEVARGVRVYPGASYP